MLASASFAWIVAGVTSTFLAGCAAYNRKQGFQKVAPELPPLFEAAQWLSHLREQLCDTDVPTADTVTSDDLFAQSAQLHRLNAALHREAAGSAEHGHSGISVHA